MPPLVYLPHHAGFFVLMPSAPVTQPDGTISTGEHRLAIEGPNVEVLERKVGHAMPRCTMSRHDMPRCAMLCLRHKAARA